MLHLFTSRLKLWILVFSSILLPILFSWSLLSPTPQMPSPSPSSVGSSLLASKDLRLQSIEIIQKLWKGYGYICHITATPSGSPYSSFETSRTGSAANSNISTPQETQSFILKLITPPKATRPKEQDEGHLRKIYSYEVEHRFYSELAPLLPPSIPVAKCLVSLNEQHSDGTSTTAMILSDLRQQYPVAGEKQSELSSIQVHAALDWLSGFHGFWWPRVKDMDRSGFVYPPLEEVKRDTNIPKNKSVWLNGGYTYLATRRTEYGKLASDQGNEWNKPLTDYEEGEPSISEMVADILAVRTNEGSSSVPTEGYQTLIHGDVKSENFFTSLSGKEVAFYDFQYVGQGLGVCDLAKLFTCSVPLAMLVTYPDASLGRELGMQSGEKALLERYWTHLTELSKKEYDWDVFVMHWEVALVDWLRFQASWGFWGNTEWLEARVRFILKDQRWRDLVKRDWKSRH
jgi:hypothetical protein